MSRQASLSGLWVLSEKGATSTNQTKEPDQSIYRTLQCAEVLLSPSSLKTPVCDSIRMSDSVAPASDSTTHPSKLLRMDWRIALLSTLCLIGFSEQTPLKDGVGSDFSTCFEMDDDGESCHRKTTRCEGDACLFPTCQSM